MNSEKIAFLKNEFENLSNEERYKKIISFGIQAPSFPEQEKTDSNKVPGCQSTLYVYSTFIDGKVEFNVWSDALISKGLAAIAAYFFSGSAPKEILNADLSFFQEIGIINSLSPSRVNGFANLITLIKKQSLLFAV